ncbi:MAG TPA: sigma-70 family RNA polymerase sigma factor [Actinoplanes sp.]
MSGDSGPFLGAAPAASARSERAARQAELFSSARAGNAAAFDTLVRELNPLLWHVVRAQGLGSEEAADVVQTTWLELVQRLREIRSPQALTGWLLTTARRQAWHVRSRQRRHDQEGAETLTNVPDSDAGPPDVLEASERGRVLWRHVQSLSDRCRELLRIVAFVDRPDYDVVAEALAMPRGSIGPTRGRCLAKLREALSADPAWEMP